MDNKKRSSPAQIRAGKKYNQSIKGKARTLKYLKSEKGKTAIRNYQQSQKGKRTIKQGIKRRQTPR